MKRIVFILCSLFYICEASAQELNSNIKSQTAKIEIDYYPSKANNVNLKDYIKGIKDLEYAYYDYRRTKSIELDYIDYWRIAIAYIYLGFTPETVYKVFLKSKNDDRTGFCEIINFQAQQDDKLKIFLGDYYYKLIEDCEEIDNDLIRKYESKKLRFIKNKDIIEWIKN